MASTAATHDDHGHDGHGHGKPNHPYHLVDPSPWPLVGSLSALLLTGGGVMWMHGVGDRPLGHAAGLSRRALRHVPLVARRPQGVGQRRPQRRRRQGPAPRHGAVHHLRGVLLLRLLLGVLLGCPLPADDHRHLVAARGHRAGPDLGHPVPEHPDPAALGRHGDLGAPCGEGGRPEDRVQGAGDHRLPRPGLHRLPGARVCRADPRGLHPSGRDLRLDLLHGDRLPRPARPDRHDLPRRLHDARLVRRLPARTSMSGFEAAAWYWHFVDVVWLFLFVWVYWWGGSLHFTTTPVGG